MNHQRNDGLSAVAVTSPWRSLAAWIALSLICAPVLGATVPEDPDPETAVLEAAQLRDIDYLLERLRDRRVVIVGETHDRFEDHLNQLAILRGLRDQGQPLAIGLECFQQPFQQALDDYVAGRIDEATMLRRTEYFERWRFDYRLYRPILRFARDRGVPLIALNLEREITETVGDRGLAGLEPARRERIPADIDRSDTAYREQVRAVFDLHPKTGDANFEHFLDVQLLWDEGMAERAARWLTAHPDSRLAVLAGIGHVAHGRGIPARLARRLPGARMATVVNASNHALQPGLADFLLFPRDIALPAAGLLGVMLDTRSPGEGLAIDGFGADSGARDAGLEVGDRLIAIAGRPIRDYTDIRVAMLDVAPGQTLSVRVLRGQLLGEARRLDVQVTLR